MAHDGLTVVLEYPVLDCLARLVESVSLGLFSRFAHECTKTMETGTGVTSVRSLDLDSQVQDTRHLRSMKRNDKPGTRSIGS